MFSSILNKFRKKALTTFVFYATNFNRSTCLTIFNRKMDYVGQSDLFKHHSRFLYGVSRHHIEVVHNKPIEYDIVNISFVDKDFVLMVDDHPQKPKIAQQIVNLNFINCVFENTEHIELMASYCISRYPTTETNKNTIQFKPNFYNSVVVVVAER